MHGMISVDFDICQRMEISRKLYSITVTYFLKVNYLKCEYLRSGES